MNLTVVRICNLDIDRNFSGVCESIDLTVKRLSLSQLRCSSLIRGRLGYSNPHISHENPTYDCSHRSD